MDNINTNDIITDSLCVKCDRLMVRVITPIDMEAFGIDEEALLELDIPEGDVIEIVYLTCLEDNNTMDYIVKECNKFKHKRKRSILNNEDPFI